MCECGLRACVLVVLVALLCFYVLAVGCCCAVAICVVSLVVSYGMMRCLGFVWYVGFLLGCG